MSSVQVWFNLRMADNLTVMALEPFETAQSHETPTVRQQSVMLENRVGQLLRLTKLFDISEVRILSMTQVFAQDCALCRLLLDDPDAGYSLMVDAGFQVSETELLVVGVPSGKRGLLKTWMALLAGEVNIHYTYPLLVHPNGHAAIAICADNVEQAADVLRMRKFELLNQSDLYQNRFE